MKSYGNLYEKVCSRETIEIAFNDAVRGKTKKSKRRIAAWCKKHKEQVINKTMHQLETETYSFRQHRPCIIYDHKSRKKRSIITPDLNNEEIIHHVIIQVLKPIIMKGMDSNCCASVPRRGCCYGKKKVEKFIKKYPKDCKYCLKLDIRHFFPSIDHDRLKVFIKKKIRDRKMQRLIFTVIDNYESESNKGLPLGYYTSQWLANWYLESLDHYIRERLKAKFYIRYMDDIVIFDSNKRRLHSIKIEIEEYMNHKLGLKLNNKWQVFRFDYEYINRKGQKIQGGIFLDFMGFRFYRNRTTLRRIIMLSLTRKAKKIIKNKVTWYAATQMMSYLGWVKNTNTYNVYETYVKGMINVKSLRKSISDKQRRVNNEHYMEVRRKYRKAG